MFSLSKKFYKFFVEGRDSHRQNFSNQTLEGETIIKNGLGFADSNRVL